VKATFFLVGQQARANPEGVRKVRDAGHTVATHTQNHPSNMQRMPIDRAQKEIEDGHRLCDGGTRRRQRARAIFAFPVSAAMTRSRPTRNPRPPALERGFSGRRLAARLPATRLRSRDPRLEAKGKAFCWLHDIQARTVAALPKILQTLKARGYHIVHVVPATPDRPADADRAAAMVHESDDGDRGDLTLAENSEFRYAATAALPAPAWFDFDWRDAELGMLTRRMRGVPLAQRTKWPSEIILAQNGAATAWAAPAGEPLQSPGIDRCHDAGHPASRRTNSAGGTLNQKPQAQGGPGAGRQVAPTSARRYDAPGAWSDGRQAFRAPEPARRTCRRGRRSKQRKAKRSRARSGLPA